MTSTNATDERIVGPDPAWGELLNVQAVAGLLACSVRHVYRLADAGKMPRPLKLGALVRWRHGEIFEWIKAGCPSVRQAKAGGR